MQRQIKIITNNLNKTTMEHCNGNQYKVNNMGILYDVECMMLYVDLGEFCSHEFGTDIRPSKRVLESVKILRGRQVYGNIRYPDKFYLEKRKYREIYDLMSQYHYDNVGTCYATYGEKTEEDIVAILEDLHSYISVNDILNNSFKELMGFYDMKYICNAEEVAEKIIDYYGGHVTNLKDGIDTFKKLTGKNI